MKVTVSVGGKFWAIDQAKQLLKRGYLDKLITSYPDFVMRKDGIPGRYTRNILIKEIWERGWKRLKLEIFFNPQFLIAETFDILAGLDIGHPDIFSGLSSFSLHSFRKAKKIGATTICDHGSSHILYQTDILKEEYEKFGLKPKTATRRIIEKILSEFEEADYISVPSKYVKQTFLDKGIPESKLLHIPYGVDLSRFKQVPKTDDVFRVVFAGGMMLRKGVHYLLQAFSELNLPNSELLLVGNKNPEIEPFFEKYKGNFKWLPAVPQAELYKYYSQGSVFVMMSIEEGLALVQAQAMACGLPVIATVNTGAEDIIRDGKDGFIIPIRDVEKLKEKIVFMYENRGKCREMGISAKEHISQGFTWDDYGNKIIAEYERILK